MLTFQKIAEITSGNIIQFKEEMPILHLLLDSRKIISSVHSLFFAVKGERHNGHKFLEELYQAGVRQFVVEVQISNMAEKFPFANILLVNSSVAALQSIAGFHRKGFSFPVLGITGSNGKTIVKEWLSQLLMKDHHVVRSPKSYNSQVGVPLSVWGMNEQHDFGIFEAGISLPGEMEKLEKVIQPTLGLITNIGPAHDDGFTNRNQKVEEKLKLFNHCPVIFYCKDHYEIDAFLLKRSESFSTFTWSRNSKNADVFIKKIEKIFGQSQITLNYQGQKTTCLVPFSDEASVENILHCISVMLYLKTDLLELQKRISLLHPVAMRLELKEGINNCYIIDDTYNNDISGLTMALNFMSQQNLSERKTLILSDVLEAGKNDREVYSEIARIVKEKNIQKFIGIGPAIQKFSDLFGSSNFYDSAEDFIQHHPFRQFNKETILVKGARKFQFEKIVAQLVRKVHGTVLHINLDAISHNLNFYRSQLKPETKIMVMVKAFAYGSGSYEVANLLQFHRVDYLGVAYADEGVSLRDNGINLPVMVMNPSAQSFSKMIDFNLEPEIYSFKILKDLIEYTASEKTHLKIHLKIDTGMRRLGFEVEEVAVLCNQLRANPHLKVASVFTHLAGADEAMHNNFSRLQLMRFNAAADVIEQCLSYAPLRHGLNSAGILRFPDMQMGMVRLGIGLYGVESNGQLQHALQEVGTLKTVISQIKKVPAGETVGYSRRGVLVQNTDVATIAIGYADGYNRKFGNGIGKIWVNGKICPTIGTVCMDMTMIDVTGANAKEGDEVIVFGKEIPVKEMADSIGTIPYEILTAINERVKRVFFAE